MKFLLISFLFYPLYGWAQVSSPAANPQLPTPYGDTLKPIDFREIPYTYTTHSTTTYRGHSHSTYSTHTGIKRIYSYDGIDVDDPEKDLWRYMNALNDPDVERLRLEFDDIVARQKTANAVGATFFYPGLVMLIIGCIEADAYKKALSQQSSYTTPPTTTYITKTCTNWGGSIDNTGTYTWTCLSDPSLTYKGQYPPPSVQVPVTTPGKTITSGPAIIDKPTGVGLAIAGTSCMLLGIIIRAATRGDQHSTFLKAVQYYNRSLKQKFSWELKPYTNFNYAGLSLVGHF